MGEQGNDLLSGGKGNDTLIGCGTDNGVNSIDTLTGGAGNDRFILGNSTAIFYDDGDITADGIADYALITD